MCDLVHLHVHTEYSLLDGASRISDLMVRAQRLGMRAIALSDHGNLFAVPAFYQQAVAHQLKPIIGCEFYFTDADTFTKDKNTYHLLLLAKDEEGWQNLLYLSSISYLEGFYYKPRIHRQLLETHRRGLITTTGCLASVINQKILRGKIDQAEKDFIWLKELFGEDFYIELQDHGLNAQHQVAEVLMRWSRQYGVPVIATNDVHYTCREDAQIHDLLLAIQTASSYDDKERFRFTDDQNNLNPHFYLKSPAEMLEMPLFRAYPESLTRTAEIAEKVTLRLNFNQSLILPRYPIPEGFSGMEAYLQHLAEEGAKKRYGDPLPEAVASRLAHELRIIAQMGFAGYFLIVQDFVAQARQQGVWVGPGRGSAAGSLVAYVLGITSVDPIAYQLLFERFLNPERVSPPDIDIDFDDEGRDKVIAYVQAKYGRQNVAQIITYGTMGIKTAIRDVGRTLHIPLPEVNKLCGYIPDKPNITLQEALDGEQNPKATFLRQIYEEPDHPLHRVVTWSEKLEGMTRHTGVHAAGVIIAPDALYKYVPLAITTRDEAQRQVITQWDGPECEKVGLLKMDFLGLKTLSILRTAVALVQKLTKSPSPIDLEHLPLDDEKTWQLFQQGQTVGIFQFESEGMQKYLRQLRPTCIEDLIAMNALYRPGPMENIPTFIRRKHGEEPITYPDPRLEPILQNTYGIMVYQEQIMQIAQVLAGYSLAEADLLRRAMGKKKKEIMEEQRSIFISRAIAAGTAPQVAEEVFDLMARFAEYGFNKSHAAAYSILAYRTGYLKANYPAAYMAALLTHHADNFDKISFFLQEVRSLGIKVLPPCVNHSDISFSVPNPQEIRFGLGGIKHLGEKFAHIIVSEREKGPYADIYDFVERLQPHGLNKKILESLAAAGALDTLLRGNRSQLLDERNRQILLDYATKKAQGLGGSTDLFSQAQTIQVAKPILRSPERVYDEMKLLRLEREYTGFFLSRHPFSQYEEIELCKLLTDASRLLTSSEEDPPKGPLRCAAMLVDIDERKSKQGRLYARLTFEDLEGVFELTVFAPFWEEQGALLKERLYEPLYLILDWVLRADSYREWRLVEAGPLHEAPPPPNRYILIEWDIRQLDRRSLLYWEQLLKKHAGKMSVRLRLHHDHRHPALLLVDQRLRYSQTLLQELREIGAVAQLN